MSAPVVLMNCFLCEKAKARTQKADADHVERFLCPKCGDYDIVGQARQFLENNPTLKAHVSAEARRLRAADATKVLEMRVDEKGNLIVKGRPRHPYPS